MQYYLIVTYGSGTLSSDKLTATTSGNMKVSPNEEIKGDKFYYEIKLNMKYCNIESPAGLIKEALYNSTALIGVEVDNINHTRRIFMDGNIYRTQTNIPSNKMNIEIYGGGTVTYNFGNLPFEYQSPNQFPAAIFALSKYLFRDIGDIKSYNKKISTKSIDFTGNNSGAMVNSPSSELTITGDVTLQIKTKIRDLSNNPILIASGNDGEANAANVTYQITVSKNGTINYKHEYNNGQDEVISTDNSYLPLNEWVDIAITRNTEDKIITFYINGVKKEQKSFSNSPNGGTDNKLSMGSWINSMYFLNGQLDEIKIWNRILTDEEIKFYYKHSVDPTSDGLVGYWPIEELDGTILSDLSPYKNNATITNGSFSDDTDLLFVSWKTIGPAPATKAMFDSDGMTNLSNIDNEAIQQLESDQPELLCWTDENVPQLENTIPIMTSDTCPKGTVIDGGTYNVSGETKVNRWDAFNGQPSGWGSPYNTKSGWIGFHFSTAKVIRQYTIQADEVSSVSFAPKDWTFEGSNDGENWTILDTQSNVTSWENLEKKTFEINNTNTFCQYRINITANNGADHIIIGEIEMFGYEPRHAILAAIPNPQLVLPKEDIEIKNFENIKIDSISPINLCVGGEPIASRYDTKNGKHIPESAFDNDASTAWDSGQYGSADDWIGYDFGASHPLVRKIVLTQMDAGHAVSGVTVQRSTDNINWIDIITVSLSQDSSIQEIKLPNTESAQYWRIKSTSGPSHGGWGWEISELKMFGCSNEDIKIVLSADEGMTWMGKTSVDISDLSSVKSNGWSPDELQTISPDQILDIVPNRKVRFAFYLEQEKLENITALTSLKINNREYIFTPTLTNLSILFQLLKSKHPTYFVSRDDGVTWKEIEPDKLVDFTDQPEGNKLRIKARLEDGQEIYALTYSWI
jgi:hypothetical protein